jgi:hypothetical protein
VLAAELDSEIAELESAYQRAVAERGRRIVGLSGLSIDKAGRYIADWLREQTPASPSTEMSARLTLRFAVDDLKACYIEVALAGSGRPSRSRSVTGCGTTPRSGRQFLPCARHI